ncbi:Acetamidase/Formamidase, partial [Wolfiporia cocos MD-104 SS10]
PDTPAFATVKPGQVVNVECVDWAGAQIGNNDRSEHIKNVDLIKSRNQSRPTVEGAEPSDFLVVKFLDVRPFDKMPQYAEARGIFELENGGGLFGKPCTPAIQGVYATSRHIFASVSYPGLIGTAPSAELLATWNKHEGELVAANPNAVPPVALLPNAACAYVRQNLPYDVREKVYRECARTVPGREHGGNCDMLHLTIKNLSKGSRCYFPVFVTGVSLSVGDLHFSQGDVSLKRAGIITFSTSIIKGGVEKFALKQPIFLPSPVDPLYSAKVSFFTESSAHGDGKQYDMDATTACKQAALNAITYLMKVYLLLSAAPVESHVSAIVDSPNACVTLALPLGIFEHDILSKEEGLTKKDFGQCGAIRSDGVV